MFEAGFTCILSKSLMNTRTSREPRHAIRVVEVLLFCSFSLAFQVRYENPHQAKSTLLRTFCNFSHMKQQLL